MDQNSEIIRIAAKGDGVTEDGRHFAHAVPGDKVAEDGAIIPGPLHVQPACRHFGTCGGCQLQNANEKALESFVRQRVLGAAEGQQVISAAVGGEGIGGFQEEKIYEGVDVLPTHISPAQSRRRAIFHCQTSKKAPPVIGFKQAATHRIIDLKQCAIVRPELWEVAQGLRQLLKRRREKGTADLALSLIDQGVDLNIKNLPIEGLEQTEELLDFARDNKLARLSIDQGYGAEDFWEPEPATVTLSGVPVGFPSNAFLQATQDGEAVLVNDAKQWLMGAGKVADLFSGLGTFSFGLPKNTKVLSVEGERSAYLSCKAAAAASGRPVHALHRDLFRAPLRVEELGGFDGIILDPPRAGARSQCEQIAASQVEKVVYISCNPSSWARDAKRLIEGGYRLAKIRAVGQFRWSTHVELSSLFLR